MSATINQETFSNYFDGAPVLTIPGRTFPVQDMFVLMLSIVARR